MGERYEYYDEQNEGPAPVQEQDLRLLKAITSDSRLALDFINSNDHNVFLGAARPVGKAVCDYIRAYKTPPTKRVLVDKYSGDKDFATQIERIFDSFPVVEFNPTEYQYDLEKIRQRYCDTKFNALKDDIRFHDKGNPDQMLEKMEHAIKDIKRVRQPSRSAYIQKPIDEYLHEFHQDYIAKIENPELGQGVLTGYSYLDYVTNGLNPAEMLIIGGETGAGKSMLLNNMAIQMWMQKNTIATDPSQYTRGYNVLYFSLEMPYKGCFRRTLARLADISTYGLRDSKLTKAETESLQMASRFIKKYSASKAKFEIVDIPRGVTVEQIEERYLEAKTRFEPDIIVVDYLGLLEDSKAEGDDWLKLGYIAGKLHEFGRAYNTRIMTAVQLNRPTKSQKNADPGELIGIHRIGRSSLIMHHANVGLQIESRKDEAARDTMVYHIIKNRDGELGRHEIKKKFANAAIFDMPFMPPDRDEFGSFVSGFDDSDDISAQVRKILKLHG